jgi:hypothetical protein
MKILITVYLIIVCVSGENARAHIAEPANYLIAETTIAGEEGRSEPARRNLRLSEEQHVFIVEAIIQKVHAICSSSTAASFESAEYIRSAAGILHQIGTDEQIIQAFGKLSSFGNSEQVAAYVLASCKGITGVEIIRKLAEERLSNLGFSIDPKDDRESAQSNHILVSFCDLILSLDSAINSEGSRAAKTLRDEVAARYVSENGKVFVVFLDKEMANARSRMKKDRSNPEPLPSKTNSDLAKVGEAGSLNVHKQVQTRSQEGIDINGLSKVAAVIAIIMVGSALAWRLMVKRESK